MTLIEAAEAVAAARLRYAEAFLRFKLRDVTDGQAHQQAILETGDELTVLEARLYLAKHPELPEEWYPLDVHKAFGILAEAQEEDRRRAAQP